MSKNTPEVVMSKVNLIGEATSINGEISTDDDLRIDGIVNGNIKTNKRIIIGTTAAINGNISANIIEINGRVKGNIEASEILILKETAILEGDIIVTKLSINTGAKFNGKCSMNNVSN